MTGTPWKPGGPSGSPKDSRVRLLILLIKAVGIVGFVGMLGASHYARGDGYGWRVGALLWFVGCGIAYVLVSSKLPDGGRRWP